MSSDAWFPHMVCLLGLLAAAGSAAAARGLNAGAPLRAVVVVSEERSGCLVSRHVREDVNLRLGEGVVRLTQDSNPEDAATWEEFFLYFDSAALGGPPGRLVLRLGVEGDQPPTPGRLELSAARAARRVEGAALELKASVRGVPRAGLYFARDYEVAVERFSCPEAGMFEPIVGSFLRVYPLQEGVVLEQVSPGILTVAVPAFLLEEARLVEKGLALLAELDRAFAVRAGEAFTWDLTGPWSERLHAVVEASGHREGLQLDVSVSVHRKGGAQTVLVGQADFLPQVRQRIGVRGADGVLFGGVALIRTESEK